MLIYDENKRKVVSLVLSHPTKPRYFRYLKDEFPCIGILSLETRFADSGELYFLLYFLQIFI